MDEILALLSQRIGLQPHTVGLRQLERTIRDRMGRMGLSAARYSDRLRGDEAEFDRLVDAVVVAETWFFREPEAFDLMVGDARARLRTRPGRPYRVLSAGCSTGAEAYSALMVFLDAGIPLDGVEIEAHDISPRSLEIGRRGVYGPNSFRGADRRQMARYFAVSGSGWAVEDELRERVHFQRANLITPSYLIGERFDAILCRNLLGSLHAEARRAAAGALLRGLRSEGLLLLGQSETLPPDLPAALGVPGTPWVYHRSPERAWQSSPVGDPAESFDTSAPQPSSGSPPVYSASATPPPWPTFVPPDRAPAEQGSDRWQQLIQRFEAAARSVGRTRVAGDPATDPRRRH